MPDFLLPDLGEGLDEAEVIAWRVQAGDHVTVDQVIAEVETAKAVVELPVPYAGVVTALHAEPGSAVSVGQPLITVTADDPAAGFREPGVVVPGQAAAAAAGSPAAGRPAAASWWDTARPPPRPAGGAVAVGPPAARRRRALRRPGRGDLAAGQKAGQGRRPRPDQPHRNGARGRREPPGRPPGHRRARRAAAARGARRPGRRHRARGPADDTERRIPLRGARRAAAEHVTRSRREIPEATVWVDVDATALVEARRELNTRDPARPVSLLALLARFAVLGLRRYPELNARVERDEIVMPGRVHLGFAAQTEHGLVVPVVHDAHLLSTRDLSARLAERTAAARERRLSPADLRGGTFTVNNYGVFGVDGSAAIINHPEVAILGMGRVIDRPWVVDGQLAVRKVTELTLAFDHRVCDGGTAGGFLRYVADCVESPVAAMGDM